jgi:hypothetical protein
VFHIQTEDSGTKYCRVVTHLFADGGRILRTSRTEYSQRLNDADVTEQVRRLMKEQHRAMAAALRAGEFDEIIRIAFESASTVIAGVSEPAPSQMPALCSPELPALSLPAPDDSGTIAVATPASRLIKRPSNRPNRRSSRPPAKIAAQHENPVDDTSEAARAGAGAAPANAARLNLGRPPMDSSESTRYAPTRSLFGDTGTSEPSLGEVILSYVEESTDKGSGRA